MTSTTDLHPRRWLALFPLLFAVFMDMVDAQIVVVALPSIREDTGASAAGLEWIAAGYTLAFAVLLLTGGRLGDRYGRKPVFLAGVAGFTVASLLAGVSTDVTWLLAARLAQGGFAGVMIPQVLAYVQSEFPAGERAKAFGIYGITFPIGGLAGPLLGGVLTSADLFGLGWRSIFLVNVPVGVLTLLAVVALMPRRAGQPGVSIDLAGVLLAALALVCFLLPLTQGWQSDWPGWSIVMLVGSVPLLAIFIRHQRRRGTGGRDSLVDPRLFRRHGFGAGLVVAWMFFAGMGVFFVLTLHLQAALGYSPMTTALSFLPATAGIIAGNGLASSVGVRRGRGLVSLGVALTGLGVAALAAIVWLTGSGLQLWQLIPAATVCGLGLGMTAGKLVNAALVDVPADESGAASGVVNTVLQVGVATGIAVVGSVYLSRLAAGSGSSTAAGIALLAAVGMLAAALIATRLLPRTPGTPLFPDQPSAAVTGRSDLSTGP